ncbi:MAG: hypothetical protein OXC71_02640, partial [Chloroflexi bacterium]|nr:hypothetical protein [Chloroflexota bacterium]
SLVLLGGLARTGGLLSAWVAIPLALSMVVAPYVKAVKRPLPFAGSENAQGYELDILIVAALVALMVGGGGPLSLDTALGG